MKRQFYSRGNNVGQGLGLPCNIKKAWVHGAALDSLSFNYPTLDQLHVACYGIQTVQTNMTHETMDEIASGDVIYRRTDLNTGIGYNYTSKWTEGDETATDEVNFPARRLHPNNIKEGEVKADWYASFKLPFVFDYFYTEYPPVNAYIQSLYTRFWASQKSFMELWPGNGQYYEIYTVQQPIEIMEWGQEFNADGTEEETDTLYNIVTPPTQNAAQRSYSRHYGYPQDKPVYTYTYRYPDYNPLDFPDGPEAYHWKEKVYTEFERSPDYFTKINLNDWTYGRHQGSGNPQLYSIYHARWGLWDSDIPPGDTSRWDAMDAYYDANPSDESAPNIDRRYIRTNTMYYPRSKLPTDWHDIQGGPFDRFPRAWYDRTIPPWVPYSDGSPSEDEAHIYLNTGFLLLYAIFDYDTEEFCGYHVIDEVKPSPMIELFQQNKEITEGSVSKANYDKLQVMLGSYTTEYQAVVDADDTSDDERETIAPQVINGVPFPTHRYTRDLPFVQEYTPLQITGINGGSTAFDPTLDEPPT